MILIATPVDGGSLETARVTLGYVAARDELRRRMPTGTLDSAMFFLTDLVRARNRAAAMALTLPGWTHVLWWDEDVIPRDLGVVERMIATGEDMIAAPYTTKGAGCGWTHYGIHESGHADRIYVDGCGFGFTLTSRKCLQTMWDATTPYDDLKRDGSSTVVRDMFGQIMTEGGKRLLLSEDYSFCHRWSYALGGNIAIYCGEGNMVGHVGSQAFDATMMPGGAK